MTSLLDLVRRGWNKPPSVILKWVGRQLKARRTARALPRYEYWLSGKTLAAALGARNFGELLSSMRASCPFPGLVDADRVASRLSEASKAAIFIRADAAMRREVDMLGSGKIELGQPIFWASDFKTGLSWPVAPSRNLPVNRLDEPCDIKVPWELSRLQWLLPVGQAYVLDGDEARAAFARDIVDEWISGNPVCRGVNWICAMDVALRAISMLWLFHACQGSEAWSDEMFLERFVKSLYLHGRFIDGNLEWSDVNGNHLTTDLAGLQIIGIGLGGTGGAKKWIEQSWRVLEAELPLQVPSDGVCREASVPYHRLVAELFLLPALARKARGLSVADAYWQRLRGMAGFVAAYTRPDGEVPIWGDADDGRALPLGTQAINDHRYLLELLAGTATSDEALWWLGTKGGTGSDKKSPTSTAFADCGVHVMRHADDYVFIDAGPVGMAGRGGHGHNDCLSFEASLMGTRLVADPGCYVYTADWQARNRFRSTAAHNTPGIDGEEINRIPRADWLWYIQDDAKPDVRHWSTSKEIDLLVAAHTGYQRLPSPVTPVRGIMLEKSTHRLFVADGFEGAGEHTVRIPYTFAPGVSVDAVNPGVWRLAAGTASFLLIASAPEEWTGSIGTAAYSPSYGIKEPVAALVFERAGPLRPLALAIVPESGAPPDPVRWLDGVVRGRFPVPGLKA